MEEYANGPIAPETPEAPTPAPAPVYVAPPRRVWTGREKWLAVLCWLMGYLFWRIAAGYAAGVGVTVTAAVFSVVLIWLGCVTGAPRGRVCAALVPFIFSVPFTLYCRSVPLFFGWVFLLAAVPMCAYYVFDRPRWDGSDWLRGLLTRPLANCLKGGAALCASTGSKKIGRGTWRVIGGILIALPLTAVVLALLASADEAFRNLTGLLTRPLNFDRAEWWLFVPRLIIAIPVGLYLFGAVWGNAAKEAGNVSDEASVRFGGALRRLHPTTLLWAGVPLCVVYALFFVSQFAYFTSAFAGLLPEGFTYAGYARQGFFQLCAVAVIDLLVLLAIRCFCRRAEERLPRSMRVYSVVLCVFTLLLIATALGKMMLYIRQYGLTPLRVYTSWFMVLLAVVFIILAVSQFWHTAKPLRAITAAFLVLFALLQFINVDGGIAAYNAARYRDGTLKSVDVSLFYELGDAAVPAAAALLDEDGDVADEVREFLILRREELPDESEWYCFNVTTARIRALLTDLQKQGKLPACD